VNSFRKALGTASLAAALCSCQIVDHFSSRAVDYNTQAEQAQLKPLLLNIVRASLGRPMQFTSLTSVTGTASESGSGTLTAPFGEAQHRPRTVSGPDTFALTTTISGGPTFTVPVLDTQEFYQGEMTPIGGSEINFFIEEGYTPAQLFYLFVNSVEFTDNNTTPAQHFTFANYVGDDFDFDQFEAVADYLMELGLTLESTRRVQKVGPELTAQQAINMRDIAAAEQAGLTLMQTRTEAGAADKPTSSGSANKRTAAGTPAKTAKRSSTTSPEAALAVASKYFQLQKTKIEYRPCFDSQVLKATGMTAMVDPHLVCESETPGSDESQTEGSLARTEGIYANQLSDRILQIRNARVFALRQAAAAARATDPARAQSLDRTAAAIAAIPPIPRNTKIQFKLLTRSTEGILFYLGSVVGRYLNPGASRAGDLAGTDPRMIQVKVGEFYLPYPMQACREGGVQSRIQDNYMCDNLFVVERGSAPSDSALSVDYEGHTYWIPSDSKVQGRTMRLVDLVKQLLALHTSAKSLPASNVLNVIGGGGP
jgi:hypothetical protein